MAQELTKRQEELSNKTRINLMTILEIEGFDISFSSSKVMRNWRIGEKGAYIGKPELRVGGTMEDTSYLPLIDPDKSTRVIQQQLEVDKGGSGSIQGINIALTDRGGLVTEAISPGFKVEDILGQEATVYLAFQGGSHPEDSFTVFQGIIDSVTPSAGYVIISVAHPSKLEDVEIFNPATTELITPINSTDTTIEVEDNSAFLKSYSFESIEFSQYVKIGDEIIKVGAHYQDDTNGVYRFQGCTRGQFGTIATSHDAEEEVSSYYTLKGEATELALALLLSDGSAGTATPTWFVENLPVTMIGRVSSFNKVSNAIFFQGDDIQKKYGLVEGDWVELSGAMNPLNNFYEPMPARQIKSFGSNSLGSWFVVDGPILIEEISSDIKVRLRSKYNVLPDGCGMSPRMVDIEQFISVKGLLGSALANYDGFKLDSEVNANEFINEQLFRPSGLYQVPRKGKVSVDSTLPTIAGREAKVLNHLNILEAEKLSITRTTNKNFYNAIVYKYDFDEVETDKARRTIVNIDQDSRRRVKTTKRLDIEAMGLSKSLESKALIDRQSKLYLDRYKFGAEEITVPVNLKTGFNIDISDAVILEAKNLKLADIRNGSRDFSTRVMQVINKSLSFSGKIQLVLLDTSFSDDGRYGTIAPSSVITGGEIDKIAVKSPYRGLDSQDSEKKKWERFLGHRVVVRSDDWTQIAETKIIGFDDINPRCFYIEPLPFTPTSGMWLDIPNYDETSERELEDYKTLYAFLTPQVKVVSAADDKTITVEAGKGDKFLPGAILDIHTEDGSFSKEVRVDSVNIDTITLKTSLGVVPDNTYLIDLIGFKDGGQPYRLL